MRRPWAIRGYVAALVVLVAVVWLYLRPTGLRRYVSPPIDAAGTRVTVLAPAGWEPDPAADRELIERCRPNGTNPCPIALFTVHPTPNQFVRSLRERFDRLPSPLRGTGRPWEQVGVRVVVYRHLSPAAPQLANLLPQGSEAVQRPASVALGQQGPALWHAMKLHIADEMHLLACYWTSDQVQFDRCHSRITASMQLIGAASAPTRGPEPQERGKRAAERQGATRRPETE